MPTVTPLLHELKTLAPMESKLLKRLTNDVPEKARFLRFAESGSTDFSWINPPTEELDRPMSPRLQMDNPVRSLLGPKIPSPRFEYYGRPAEQEHIYRSGEVLLVTDVVLDCLARFDRDGFEHRSVSIEGHGNRHVYFLVLPVRSVDPVDTSRTTVTIESAPVFPGSTIHIRQAWFNEGYTVREDLPKSEHILRNTYNADILFSLELIDCLKSSGASGISFERTEGGRAPQVGSVSL